MMTCKKTQHHKKYIMYYLWWAANINDYYCNYRSGEVGSDDL